MSASLIGRLGSSAFRLSTTAVSMSLTGSCFSPESAQGPSTMGSEDEVEQSFGRPCRQLNGRSKQTYELTSSVVPRGTSFHRSVELECPPVDSIGSDLAGLSCCCRGLLRVQRNSVPSTRIRCMTTANISLPCGTRVCEGVALLLRRLAKGTTGRSATASCGNYPEGCQPKRCSASREFATTFNSAK